MRSTLYGLLVFLIGCSISSGVDQAERKRGLCYIAIERQAGNAIDTHCRGLVPAFLLKKSDLPTRTHAWFHHRAQMCVVSTDASLQQTFCEGNAPEDWTALWQDWGAAHLTAQTGSPPSDDQLEIYLNELGLKGDPTAGQVLKGCNQDCRWWTAQTERFSSADELSLFYADTITMSDDMPARMVAWSESCSAPTGQSLCNLEDTDSAGEIDAAWNTWVGDAVLRQHRHHGLSLDESMLTEEVYRVRRHFQLWGLPWSARGAPSVGDGHAWVRAGQ